MLKYLHICKKNSTFAADLKRNKHLFIQIQHGTMKKFFFLTCLMMTALFAFGEAKKVAILEIQDNEHVLEHGQKIMLQSSLAKAVAKTPGYEAFDRTSMDELMGEQLFQQSAFADQSKICEMGKLAGAAYILVSEATKTQDRKIVVAVKLLNVETAKVEISDNAVMGTSSEEMQQGCNQLASTLFDRRKSLFKKDEATGGKKKELLTRVGSQYVYDGSKMKAKEYEQFLVRHCTPAYKQFHNGKIMIYSGYATLALGVVGVGIGAPIMAKSTKAYTAGAAMVAIGAVSLAGSATLFTFGIINQRKSINTFNTQCISQRTPLQFDLTAGANGLGVAMKF